MTGSVNLVHTCKIQDKMLLGMTQRQSKVSNAKGEQQGRRGNNPCVQSPSKIWNPFSALSSFISFKEYGGKHISFQGDRNSLLILFTSSLTPPDVFEKLWRTMENGQSWIGKSTSFPQSLMRPARSIQLVRSQVKLNPFTVQ